MNGKTMKSMGMIGEVHCRSTDTESGSRGAILPGHRVLFMDPPLLLVPNKLSVSSRDKRSARIAKPCAEHCSSRTVPLPSQVVELLLTFLLPYLSASVPAFQGFFSRRLSPASATRRNRDPAY